MSVTVNPPLPTSETRRNRTDPTLRCRPPRSRPRHQSEALAQAIDLAKARQSLPLPSANGAAVDLDVWVLHVRYERTHSPAVQAELAEIYRGYAAALARRLHREGEPLEDLVQVAMEALLRAIDRFETERGLPFPAYATPTIIGSLKRHYRDLGWSMRVPRRVHEVAAPVREAADRLTVQLGRSPQVSEVAAELGLTVEQVLEAQEASYARSTRSLDSPRGEDGSQFEVLGAADPEFAKSEDHLALQGALEHLSETERELVQLYFVEEMTQSDIGERLGVSQMQVSRLLAATVRRLRGHMIAA
jgi:RNA polymerase sigma-B factor